MISATASMQDNVRELAAAIEANTGKPKPGAVMVVLGSGLGRFADSFDNLRTVPYADIPGMPVSTVAGHAGSLMVGESSGRQIFALSGRFHLYEGYDPNTIVLPLRALAVMGVGTVILTNAAGALDPQFDAGDLMLITDHINHTGFSPLRGENADDFGPRFPDMSQVYDPQLLAIARDKARETGVRLERGVYIQVPGPQLETPAETRAFKRLGADAIGMSTAIEAVAMHHMGVKVLGISCLTNKNLPDCMERTTHEDVIRQAAESSEKLIRLLDAVIAALP